VAGLERSHPVARTRVSRSEPRSRFPGPPCRFVIFDPAGRGSDMIAGRPANGRSYDGPADGPRSQTLMSAPATQCPRWCQAPAGRRPVSALGAGWEPGPEPAPQLPAVPPAPAARGRRPVLCTAPPRSEHPAPPARSVPAAGGWGRGAGGSWFFLLVGPERPGFCGG